MLAGDEYRRLMRDLEGHVVGRPDVPYLLLLLHQLTRHLACVVAAKRGREAGTLPQEVVTLQHLLQWVERWESVVSSARVRLVVLDARRIALEAGAQLDQAGDRSGDV